MVLISSKGVRCKCILYIGRCEKTNCLVFGLHRIIVVVVGRTRLRKKTISRWYFTRVVCLSTGILRRKYKLMT